MNNRPDTLRALLSAHPDAFVVLSNGLTAREAAHFHRQERCLYLLHAMGEALAVGVGLAQARPELEVVVIEGDGNALMGLAAWSLMPLPNLRYYVLDNGLFETTGGQVLPPLPAVPSWCTVVPIAPGKADTPNPPPPAEIWRDCRRWLVRHGHLKELTP
jgi:pyruvate/2-oxoacid:ferredoxin oxidoreductase beta subunit